MTETTRFVIQFISADNGERSEPITGDMEQVKDVLRYLQEEYGPEVNDDYCLMVGIVEPETEELQITRTPLQKVSSLIQMMLGTIENGEGTDSSTTTDSISATALHRSSIG